MLKITIGAMLGAVIGFIICSLLNANKKVDSRHNKELYKIVEETRYLLCQVGGLKDRLENIENKADLEHKELKEMIKEVELNSTVGTNMLYAVRQEVKELKETTCRQANNLKNCIKSKNKRTGRKKINE